MRFLPAAGHRRMAWKNGGGETLEIAVSPASGDTAAFDWRVSMARVAGDGPFSTFDGIDRTLAVIDGDGLDLDVGGTAYRALRDGPPVAFAGDVPTHARLMGGPVDDLNVMTRRGCCAATVTRLQVGRGACEVDVAETTIVLCAEGRLSVADFALAPRDALLREGAEGRLALCAEAPSTVFCIRISGGTRGPR